jgi:hypothetical protein
LGITEHGLQFLINQHRNPKFWEETLPGQWRLKSAAAMSSSPAKDLPLSCAFTENSVLEDREEAGYIIIGKGYP